MSSAFKKAISPLPSFKLENVMLRIQKDENHDFKNTGKSVYCCPTLVPFQIDPKEARNLICSPTDLILPPFLENYSDSLTFCCQIFFSPSLGSLFSETRRK